MVRARYTFGTEDQDAVDYLTCWQVLSARGQKQTPATEKEVERDERLLAALKDIGDPIGEVRPRQPDLRNYELRLSGGVIDVEDDDLLLLLDYLKSMPFFPQMRASARATRERLSLAERYTVEDSAKSEQSIPDMGKRPHRVKAS